MPIVCWKLRPPNSTNMLSIRNSSVLMTSVSEYFCGYVRLNFYKICFGVTENNILKTTISIFMKETLIDNFLKFRLQFIMRNSCVKSKLSVLLIFKNACAFKLSKSSLVFLRILIWVTPLLAYVMLQYVWSSSFTAVRILVRIWERSFVEHLAEPAI